MPDVKPKINLREMTETGPGNAQYACVEKVKGDQADERLPIAGVQVAPRGQVGPEDIGRDGVAEERQIRPAGGKKRKADVHRAHHLPGIGSLFGPASGHPQCGLPKVFLGFRKRIFKKPSEIVFEIVLAGISVKFGS
jgi:hypothetical protein